jgi:hypothetical protein
MKNTVSYRRGNEDARKGRPALVDHNGKGTGEAQDWSKAEQRQYLMGYWG